MTWKPRSSACSSNWHAGSAEDAEDLLAHAHDQLDRTDDFDDYWDQLPVPDAWTFGRVRHRIRELTGPGPDGQPFDQFLRALHERLSAKYGQTDPVAKRAKQQLAEYRRQHLLPDTQTLEKVMRYESHLSRQFHRDLHELERLQALRQGQPIAAPLVMDVDIVGAPDPQRP